MDPKQVGAAERSAIMKHLRRRASCQGSPCWIPPQILCNLNGDVDPFGYWQRSEVYLILYRLQEDPAWEDGHVEQRLVLEVLRHS